MGPRHPFRGRLQGKVAIVTGAGTAGTGFGTGKAIAVVFAGEGARVALIEQDAARAEATLSIIRAAGGDAFICTADVTRESDCARAVGATIEKYGQLDILVNNVGVGRGASIRTLDETLWRQMLAVNLDSTVWMTKHAIGHMIERRSGAIVNLASIAALRASGGTVYGPVKAAIVSLTRELAVMHGRDGIRCNAIAPGHLRTPAVEAMVDTEMLELRRKVAPLGIEGDAWDVAAAALFLASDEARFITGTCLPVDGGLIETAPLAAHRLIGQGP